MRDKELDKLHEAILGVIILNDGYINRKVLDILEGKEKSIDKKALREIEKSLGDGIQIIASMMRRLDKLAQTVK